MAYHVICISRQFGSGGHEIGKDLAERLKVPFYDKNLVEIAAERSGIHPQTLEKADERRTNPWLYESLHEENQTFGRGLPASDALFQLQSQIILEAAQKEDCVIVGRCAGYLLHQNQIPCISLFICAPFEERVRRKKELEGLKEKAAYDLVRKEDKYRKAYYNYYTGEDWGKPETYDFCINSAEKGIGFTTDLLYRLLRREEWCQ